jgi:hypothetical protein
LPGASRNVPVSAPVHFVSEDPVLQEVLCEYYQCEVGGDYRVEFTFHNSSSDWIRSHALSLASLTTLVLVTHSSDVRWKVYHADQLYQGEKRVRSGMWFILPFYTGLLSTTGGTLLNTYRDPSKLQQFCLNERPGRWRRVFEGDQSEFCRDYKQFLQTTVLELSQEWKFLQNKMAEPSR